jgi:Flp pilus assembly protein TadD
VKLAGAVLGVHAIPAPAEAERLATELEERFPDDKVSLLKVSGALRSLAWIQASAEDRATMDSRATRAIRRVVELDPGYRQAAADLISIEQAAGNGASAIRIARNLIAARQSAETHAALAQALAFDGLCEDALRHVDEAITRSPNGSDMATVDSSTALSHAAGSGKPSGKSFAFSPRPGTAIQGVAWARTSARMA